jgi:uncharacterized protein YegP (UPF0339 family)
MSVVLPDKFIIDSAFKYFNRKMDKDTLLLLLNQKWNCTLPFGWIPVTNNEIIADTEIYDSDYLKYYVDEVKEILKETLKISSLYEIREDGQINELTLDECDFEYDGLEYIYTDKNLNFILYFSHENSTTIGGKALLDEIHKIWVDYYLHFWKPHLT